MAPEKRPAFQFYPRDFLTDERVRLMSHTERGVYITLLSLCWLEKSLPLETDALAKLVEIPLKRFTKLWEHSPLKRCFEVQADGRLHQKRLDEERAKQERFGRRQSDNAHARWNALPDAAALPETALPSLSPREEERKEKTEDSGILEKGSGGKPPPLAPPDLGDRARLLLERYAGWYRHYRHGATLRLLHNSLEFDDACSLCDHWDDARLEKLAAIVLTTDDEYITKSDRGFKVFVTKASWADDRLTQWEQKQKVAV